MLTDPPDPASEADANAVKVEALTFAKGAGITLTSKFGSRALLLAVQILLARQLGPAGFGLFALGQVALQVMQQVGTLGLAAGVIRFGVPARQAGAEDFARFLRHILFVTLVSSVIFGGGGLLLAPWLASTVLKRPELVMVLRGFSVAAALVIWLNVLSAVTRISKRMQYSALALDVVPPFVSLLMLGVLAYGFHLSIGWAVVAITAGYAVGVGVSSWFVARLYPGTPLPGPLSGLEIKKLLSFSLPNLFTGIFNLWLPNVTILLLGYFGVAAGQIGIFQAAEQISSLAAIVLLAFNTMFSPQIAELYRKQENRRLNELFTISTVWGLYIGLPLSLVIGLMSTQVMSVVFGSSYKSGGLLLIMMMAAQLINSATGAVGAILSMTHHQNRLLLRTATSFVACTLLNLWLTPMWGTIGAAISLMSGIALLNVSALLDVRHLLKLWPYDRRYYKMGLALLVDAPVTYLLSRVWSEATFLHLALTAMISVAVFGGVLLALGLEKYEIELFAKLKIRIGHLLGAS